MYSSDPMPRTARAAAGGVCYHFINRGNDRRQVFRKDGDWPLAGVGEPGLGVAELEVLRRSRHALWKPAVGGEDSPAARLAINAAPARPAPQDETINVPVPFSALLDHLHGRGPQRRGPCLVHGQLTDREHTFSVNLANNVLQCFQRDCAAHGNVLDFWAAVHRLPLYEAALRLADTFQLLRNREEEPVQ